MSAPFIVGQRIEGTVEKLIFGGDGLVRFKKMAIFVPEVLPDERIELGIRDIRANFARGKCVAIRAKSPHRVAPICPHAGVCGGCQLQHLNTSMHLPVKEGWLREALHKSLPPDFPITSHGAHAAWSYRRKITLHAQRQLGHWAVGYKDATGQRVIPIGACPLFFKDHEAGFLPKIRTILSERTPPHLRCLDLSLLRLPDGSIGMLLPGRNSPFAGELGLATINDRATFSFTALGKKWHYSAASFIQNHPAQSEKLWGDVIALTHALGRNVAIFDLYAGIGVTAISLSSLGHDVTAIESSGPAVEAAKKNLQDFELDPAKATHILQGSVEELVPKLGKKADCWLVNPPRSGLSKEMLSLTLDKKPEYVVYVSCCPPTLARDVEALVRSGWAIESVSCYDMFPQTTHFETLIALHKKPPGAP